MREGQQLVALAGLHELLHGHAIDYWLFGGWAVDFHVGQVTRSHDDLDLAVWADDRDRIHTLLRAEGWNHAPEPGEDGYTGYVRGRVRLELAFLARDEDGEVYTPLRDGRGTWPSKSFESSLAELRGIRVRIVSLDALRRDKADVRDDAIVAAKDRADSQALAAADQRPTA